MTDRTDPVKPQGMALPKLGDRLKRPADTTTAAPRPSATIVEDPPKEQDRAPRGPVASVVTGTAIYIRPELLDQIRDWRRSHEITNGDLILDAIQATIDQLPDLIAPTPVSADGMFARESRQHHVGKVQFSARLRGDNVAVIDELVDKFEAGSRSRLIEAALAAYLPTVAR